MPVELSGGLLIYDWNILAAAFTPLVHVVFALLGLSFVRQVDVYMNLFAGNAFLPH